jgi:excisionase family DNA binding protein
MEITNYTVKQLADILGISRIAVFKKIQNGSIKAKKRGRMYYIPRKELKDVVYSSLSDKLKNEIEHGVKKVIREYGELLKMLGKE